MFNVYQTHVHQVSGFRNVTFQCSKRPFHSVNLNYAWQKRNVVSNVDQPDNIDQPHNVDQSCDLTSSAAAASGISWEHCQEARHLPPLCVRYLTTCKNSVFDMSRYGLSPELVARPQSSYSDEETVCMTQLCRRCLIPRSSYINSPDSALAMYADSWKPSSRQLYKQGSEKVQRAATAGGAECCLVSFSFTRCQRVSTGHKKFHSDAGWVWVEGE